MKIIKCKDSEMYPFRLKKCGRIKCIFWDHNGRAYYRRGSPLYVEILDDGENVQLWEEV